MRQHELVRNPALVVIEGGLRRQALPPRLRQPLILIALASTIVTVALGVIVAGSSSATPVDDRMWEFANGISSSIGAALFIDAAGEPLGAISLILLISVVCVVLGRWRLALLAIASQAVVGATTNLLKPLFGRTIHGSFLSYPSGHTAGATAFALVVGLLVVDLVRARPPAAVPVLLGAACCAGAVAAWAQTILVAHYPTDTLGGFCLVLALIVPTALVIDDLVRRVLALRVFASSSASDGE